MRLTIPTPRRVGHGHVRARLADGGAVALRPLHHGETEPLLTVFDGLSPRSRQTRYLAAMPQLPSSFRRALSDVDGCDRVAWLATVERRPVGIGRYVRTTPDAADIAFEVVDAHQNRGIGWALVDAVCTVAAARGIAWLEAVVDPDNAPSIAVLRRLGLRLVDDGGVLTGHGRLHLLAPARVDRGAVLTLAGRVHPARRVGAPAPAGGL